MFIVFFGVLFGALVYYAFWGINRVIEEISEESTLRVAAQIKSLIESGLKGANLNKLAKSNKNTLHQLTLTESDTYSAIDDLFLINAENRIIFSMNPGKEGQTFEKEINIEFSTDHRESEIQLIRQKAIGGYVAIWPIAGSNNVQGVLKISSRSGGFRPILHNLTVKFYLIGFMALLGVIIISFIGTRLLESPVRNIEKAMTAIDKSKFGFRLKSKSDDEHAEVYQKVNQALKRLEQLDSIHRASVQKKNVVLKEMQTILRFLDIMAHEIKNPLHAMVINLDVLMTKLHKSQGKEDTLKHAEILEKEMDHLQELIRGFLSYVRPGVPQKQRTNVNEVIKAVCQLVAAEAEKYEVKIVTRLSKALRDILVDRGQFQQAIHNIVINAIQATGEGGKINIRTWAKRKRVTISVKDAGAGISKEQLKKIFDLYFTTKKGGSGLGLPITKRIVEANEGQMQLESKLRKGTTVTLIFFSP